MFTQSRMFKLFCLIFVVLLLTACGPSAEEVATMTAAAWTETPTVTATATATSTATPLPTATSTPQPLPQLITDDNANRLQIMSTLGRSTAEAFAWSPDGKQIAIAGALGLWVYGSNDLGDIYHRETSSPQVSIAYSPDGTHIATGGMDGVIHLWKAISGEEVEQLQNPGKVISALIFSPDSTRLASSGYVAGTDFYQTKIGTPNAEIETWDVAGGEVTQTFQTRVIAVQHLSYTPDGQKLISGGCTGSFDPGFHGASSTGYIEVWDIEAGKATNAWIHGKSIERMAVMPDGVTLVTVGEGEPEIKFWNLTNGTVDNFRAYSSTWIAAASDVAVSPDGTMMVTTGYGLTGIGLSSGGGMVAWALPDRKQTLVFEGRGSIMTFSPQGDRIAGLAGDGIQIWNTSTGETLASLLDHSGISAVEIAADDSYYFNGQIAISPDNQQIAGSWYSNVVIWNLVGEHPMPNSISASYALGYSADGKHLVAGSLQGVHLWNTESLELADEITIGEGYYMRNVILSQDSTVLAAFWTPNVPTGEKYTLLWDLTGQRDPAQFYFPEGYEVRALGNEGHILALDRVPFTPSPIQFLTFKDNWKSWEFPYVDINRADDADSTDIATSEFSPNNTQIVTCGLRDASARLWRLGDSKPTTALTLGKAGYYEARENRHYPPTNICHDIAYSPDGSLIALALMDKGVALYNTSLSNKIAHLSNPEQTLAVTFSKDGKMLAALGADGRIWVWQVLE